MLLRRCRDNVGANDGMACAKKSGNRNGLRGQTGNPISAKPVAELFSIDYNPEPVLLAFSHEKTFRFPLPYSFAK